MKKEYFDGRLIHKDNGKIDDSIFLENHSKDWQRQRHSSFIITHKKTGESSIIDITDKRFNEFFKPPQEDSSQCMRKGLVGILGQEYQAAIDKLVMKGEREMYMQGSIADLTMLQQLFSRGYEPAMVCPVDTLVIYELKEEEDENTLSIYHFSASTKLDDPHGQFVLKNGIKVEGREELNEQALFKEYLIQMGPKKLSAFLENRVDHGFLASDWLDVAKVTSDRHVFGMGCQKLEVLNEEPSFSAIAELNPLHVLGEECYEAADVSWPEIFSKADFVDNGIEFYPRVDLRMKAEDVLRDSFGEAVDLSLIIKEDKIIDLPMMVAKAVSKVNTVVNFNGEKIRAVGLQSFSTSTFIFEKQGNTVCASVLVDVMALQPISSKERGYLALKKLEDGVCWEWVSEMPGEGFEPVAKLKLDLYDYGYLVSDEYGEKGFVAIDEAQPSTAARLMKRDRSRFNPFSVKLVNRKVIFSIDESVVVELFSTLPSLYKESGPFYGDVSAYTESRSALLKEALPVCGEKGVVSCRIYKQENNTLSLVKSSTYVLLPKRNAMEETALISAFNVKEACAVAISALSSLSIFGYSPAKDAEKVESEHSDTETNSNGSEEDEGFELVDFNMYLNK